MAYTKYKTKTKKPEKSRKQLHLEQILSFLHVDICPITGIVTSKLESLNYSSLAEVYTWGRTPLLRYTPEALTTYATTLYRHIPALGGTTVSEMDYVARWLAPEEKIKAWFCSKEADFIDTLGTILAAPMQYPAHIIDDSSLCTQVCAFLVGDRELFDDLPAFFCCLRSPLRVHVKDVIDGLVDRRVVDLLAEVDTMRNACNAELDSFIGSEIEKYTGLCKERLTYYGFNPDDIELLKYKKDLLPAGDWAIISKAIENKVVPKNVKKLIRASVKAIKDAPAEPEPVLDPAIAVDASEVFIQNFVPQLETEYSKTKTMTINAQDGIKDADLDDLMGMVRALQLAQVREISFEALQSQQIQSEAWYSDFTSIVQPLTACLQIALNLISPSVLLAPEVLAHKAILGMLAFAEYVKTRRTARMPMDYEQLAQELWHQLKHHTAAFLDLPPLPDVQPVSTEFLLDAIASTIQQQPKVLDLSFDKTIDIQQKLNELRPTTALTEYAEMSLSEAEIQSLVPVPDHTITELLVLFAGTGTTPYLLRGDLIARTADGLYLKIVPELDYDGYANYKFTAVNRKTLNFLIDRHCELLYDTPAYEGLISYHRDAGEEILGIPPEYDYTLTEADINLIKAFTGDDIDDASAIDTGITDADLDDCTLSTLNALFKARMQSSREYLRLAALSDRLDSQSRTYWEDVELLEYLQAVVERVYEGLEQSYHVPFTHYYEPPVYISGHYLSAWVYFREEYTEKIKAGEYSVDHRKIGKKHRSNNDPDNLKIELIGYNAGRTSRSIGVDYNGKPYVSLSAYCTNTNAGKYNNLQELIDKLQPGETAEYNGRIYTMGEERQLTATDAELKAPKIIYNDMPYASLAAFAKAIKLSPDALRQALSKAKKDGNTEFEHKFKNKKYWFYLEENGSVKITN